LHGVATAGRAGLDAGDNPIAASAPLAPGLAAGDRAETQAGLVGWPAETTNAPAVAITAPRHPGRIGAPESRRTQARRTHELLAPDVVGTR
jgi:hypothetical protein